MKLKKAIEIQKELLDADNIDLTEDEKDAIKLLIEAGKRLVENRRDFPETAWLLLPGETEN
ncbi:hypothetical protein ES705_47759 [subsurface metagenome]